MPDNIAHNNIESGTTATISEKPIVATPSPKAERPSTLKKQTARGMKWLVVASFLQKAMSVGTMIILARILNPSIFGLFALAFVAIDALGLFKSMGFDSALIQRKDNVEKASSTAFFVVCLIGISLFLILNAFAPYAGKFLNSHEVVNVIRALGLVFILNCANMIPKALLRKEMRFAKVAFSETISAIAYSVTAISMALIGFGVWSLVLGYLARTLIMTCMFWYFAKWRPKFIFDTKIAVEMFRFGKFLLLGGIIWFLKSSLDHLMVGKLLGVAALGLYAIAFNISNFCADYLGGRINVVVFSAYSKLQDNLHDLRSAALKTLKYVSIIAIPFGIGLFLLSKQFILVVYGEKWAGAAGILSILAWVGIFNTLPAGLGPIFLACGKPKLGFWIVSLQVGIFFMLLTPMAKWYGINGIGMAVGFASFMAFFITLFWAMKLLNITLHQIYMSLKPALFASMFMVCGIIFTKYLLEQSKIDILLPYNFILLFVSAIVIYGFFLFKNERRIFKEIQELISM